jgi:hypothetical protein
MGRFLVLETVPKQKEGHTLAITYLPSKDENYFYFPTGQPENIILFKSMVDLQFFICNVIFKKKNFILRLTHSVGSNFKSIFY